MASFFTITGIQKSGNTWLAAMVRALPSVSLNTRGADLSFQLRCVQRFVDAYNLRVERRDHIRPNHVARSLLSSAAEGAVSFSSPRAAAEAITVLARQMTFDASKGLSPTCTSVDVLGPALLATMSEDNVPKTTNVESCGAIGKHLPVNVLRRDFPDFKIVWVIRDPRDVLISWFYHDLRAMTPHKARHFLRKRTWGRVLNRLGLIEPERIPLELRHDWKAAYFSGRARELCRFYADGWAQRDQCLLVRYEELLENCQGQLQRVAAHLGVTASTAQVHEIASRFSFSRLTGGSSEVVGGHVRRGRSGDWLNYFDQELLSALSPAFIRLVRDLGYEKTDDWVNRIPSVAPRVLDRQRLNVRGSAVRALSDYWKDDPDLQKRFTQPINDLGSDSYCEWLSNSRLPRVRECLHQLNWLGEQWGQLDLVVRPLADQMICESSSQDVKAA